MTKLIFIAILCQAAYCAPNFARQTTGATSANASKQEGMAIEQNKILKAAVNLNTASQLSPDFSKKFISGDPKCNPLGVEADWQMAQNKLKEECKKRVCEKQHQTKKLVELLNKPPSKACVKQLGTGSMICAAKKIMNNVVEDPYYQIRLYGNVIQLVKDGKVKFMGVVENFHYKVKTKLKERISSLKNPTAVLVFNRMGALIGQTGEIPKPNKSEPCTSCLQALTMKAAEEGQNENCDSCEPYMSITGPKCGTFRDVHDPETDSSNNNGNNSSGKDKSEGDK